MLLEYAAAAGGLVLVGGTAALLALLALTSRSNDQGAYQAAELAALTGRPAGPPWPEPGSQVPCPSPTCRGRRCASWRRRGIPCGHPGIPDRLPAYRAGLPLPRDGRHSTSAAVVRWLGGDWWEAPLPVRLRRQLARTAGATRVPVQLGPPLGRLP